MARFPLIIRFATGVILGASSFRLTGKRIKRLAGDRGYRGKKEMDGAQILIPDTPRAKDTWIGMFR